MSLNPFDTEYPVPSFYFKISVMGLLGSIFSDDGSFQEVSGLEVSRKIEELEAGGENEVVYKIPGKISYTNLTLKRGLLRSKSPIWTWCNDILEGHIEYPIAVHNITVSLMDPSSSMVPLVVWQFKDAYPCKWSISSFKSDENAYAVESMEFAFKSFEKMKLSM